MKVHIECEEGVVLLRFEVCNHRSIREPVELSMIAVDRDRVPARSFDRVNEQVLTVAGIYGPNASGKSNVLEALSWLSAAVAGSLRTWEDFVPREPFRFGDGPGSSSTYEIDLVVESIRYQYRLEVDDLSVLFEGLYAFPERRRRVVFEREGMSLHFRRGVSGMPGTKELLTPCTLALSAAMRFDEPEIRSFARALVGIRALGVGRRRGLRRSVGAGGIGLSATARLFDDRDPPQPSLFDDDTDRVDVRDAALALLRFADLGIDDVLIVDPAAEVDSRLSSRQRASSQRQLRLVHRVGEEELAFDLDDESAGTRTWFELIGPILRSLDLGQLLLFDEIDASLHPRLSARLLELFQDPLTNPRGAQLVFTTHDTSLLNHLNRDEVWLTEKSSHGATALTALAEYGGEMVRRSLNLEKAYLQGRFGAVPEPDRYVLLHALGLDSERP